MHEKNKYRYIPWNRYNLEKYRDINFWSYRPALVDITGYSAMIPVRSERIYSIQSALKCARRELKLYIFTEVYDVTLVRACREQWTLCREQWTLCREQWTLCREQWTLCREQWTLCREQWTLCREQWTLCREQWTLCREQWTLCREQWTLCREQWTLCREQWTLCREQWTLCREQWTLCREQWTLCREHGVDWIRDIQFSSQEVTSLNVLRSKARF